MSRIGRRAISLPENITVQFTRQLIVVTGIKGKLTKFLPSFLYCSFDLKRKKLYLKTKTRLKFIRPLYGLYRTLILEMIGGVSTGFSQSLQLIGVGYRAQMKKKEIMLDIGYSYTVSLPIPRGIISTIGPSNKIKLIGKKKTSIAQFAAQIRSVRPPEPYKGKGILYANEVILKKSGKIGK